MSSGGEKVDAAVDSSIRYSPLAVHMQLLFQVFFILLIDILHYGLPAKGRCGREESGSDQTFKGFFWIQYLTFLHLFVYFCSFVHTEHYILLKKIKSEKIELIFCLNCVSQKEIKSIV